MSGRSPRRHGAALSAPDEGVVIGESPPPGAVGPAGSAGPPSLGRRILVVLRVVAGVLLVVVSSSAVAFSAHRYAVTSPRFGLHRIEVVGGKRFQSETVRQVFGVELGSNIFALDTKTLEQKLVRDPWLAEARVARRLPDVLEVTLREREAVAIAAIRDTLYLVSREGEPFKRVEAGDPADLPVITGLSADNLGRDRARELERLAKGLEVLAQYERVGMSKSYVAEEVHLGETGSVTLVVGREGISLWLGPGPLRQRLLMAERVVNEARRAGRVPAVVFADNAAHPERVVVRLR